MNTPRPPRPTRPTRPTRPATPTTGPRSSFARFLAVGVANTLVYYVAYRLLLLGLPYLPAHLVAYAVGIVFSFFANSLFTFGVRPTWRRFLIFPSTTLANFFLVTLGSVVLVEQGWVDERWATLLMTVAAVPITFLLTRLVLTSRRDGQAESGA